MTSPLSRWQQLLQLLLLLLVGVAIMVLPPWIEPASTSVAFRCFALQQGGRHLLLLLLVLLLMRTSGEPLAAMGWQTLQWRQELRLGVLLFPAFYLALALLLLLLQLIGMEVPAAGEVPTVQLLPNQRSDQLLALLFLLLVAVTEELIFRGWLLYRLRTLLAGEWWPIMLSSLLFAAGHSYQGSIGVVTTAVIGIMLCRLVLWRRSLVAAMVIHFLQNFTTVLLLPRLLP